MSCQSTGRGPSAEGKDDRPLHLVIATHGLGGSIKTFGALSEVLGRHLRKIEQGYRVMVIPYVYETGNDKKTTYDFASGLGDHIHFLMKDRNNPKDKISLVAHSQGGIISWIWYVKSLYGDEGYQGYKAYADKVEAVLTLGSPMWGSRAAVIGSAVNKISDKIGSLFGGTNELGEMAYGSPTLYNLRQRAIEADKQSAYVPARSLAIGGVMPVSTSKKMRARSPWDQFKMTALEFNGGRGQNLRFEADGAVAAARARFNFIYADGKGKDHIAFDDFKLMGKEKFDYFVLVEGTHFTSDPIDHPDITEIPADCAKLEKTTDKDGKEAWKVCYHPTYPYILSFLNICSTDPGGCNRDEYNRIVLPFITLENLQKYTPPDLTPMTLKTFAVDFNFIVPPNYDTSILKRKDLEKYASFKHHRKVGFPLPFAADVVGFDPQDPTYEVVLGDGTGFVTRNLRVEEYFDPRRNEKQKHVRMTMYGYIRQSPSIYDEARYNAAVVKGLKLPMKIQLPGLPEKSVDLRVRPSYSTFIEFDLRPGN